MRLTVLSDNNGAEGLEGEWGLSIFIEYQGLKILLDAGASDLFLTNAEKLGIDLNELDFAILSHAHYDHGNGFVPLLERNRQVKVYLQKCCRANCYKLTEDELEYIGIPAELSRSYEDRLTRVDGDFRLADGVYLIPHKKPARDKIGLREKMYRRDGMRLMPDDFSHEQSLVLDTDKGLVIFNSCSHAGASSIIEEVRETFPDKEVYAMIGGFHLFNKTEDEVRSFARQLRDTGVERICTGHCTGSEAYLILEQELGDKVSQFSAGLVMEL